MTERCVGCGGEFPRIEGPTHRYMTSAPGCWQRYRALLEVLYSQPGLRSALVMCVDTYAVQHPGAPGPQAIQSVAVHLLNMHGYLVRGRPVQIPQKTFSERAFDAIVPTSRRALFWLEPPSFSGSLTVLDMPITGTGDEITVGAQAWAQAVWMAWAPHHVQVAEWYATYATAK
jgi:hypothetical protein